MRTFASLFSGGGLADVGAIQAGYKPLWGVEYDASIAGVYRRNIGEHIIVSACQDVDYSSLATPYWLHMSPPCINASQANTQAGETEMDMELAKACCRAIVMLQPPMVSLENVWQYRNFASFARILHSLTTYGYAFKFWSLNSANYGVPQTRKRLFLVASRIRQPAKPAHTHRKARDDQQLSFFPLPSWVGWYEAIEDLIPELPDDEFAPWQIPLLPAEIQSMLVAQGKYGDRLVTVNADRPAFTVTANSNQSSIRGVLVRGDNNGQGRGKRHRDSEEPSQALSANGATPRAWLVGQNSELTTRPLDSPAMVVLSSEKSADRRAFLADGQANSNGRALTVRSGDSRAITASATQDKRPIRAHVGWRVVRMTARAVARFQSVPDSYELTGIKSLDFRVIGNGVPCLMMQRLMEAQE